jgi:putative salt-induced outer membrane protein YdiY
MMKKTLLSSSLLGSLLLLPTIGFAEDSATPSTEAADQSAIAAQWSGDAELGFIQTSGNSDTQSFNGKFSLVRELEPSTTSLFLEALTSEEDGDTSKEKYNAEIKYDYSLSKRSYVASLLDYEDDRFNGYEYQSTLAIGYGYHAWNDENRGKLNLEVGPGHRRSVLEEKNEDGDKVEEGTVARASLNLLLKLGEGAKFTEKFSVEAGDSSTVYKSDMALQSTLVGKLAMKVNYQVKHTTDVPDGIKNTDSMVGVTLVYSF